MAFKNTFGTCEHYEPGREQHEFCKRDNVCYECACACHDQCTDTCPNDAENDDDKDGICAQEDKCPKDAKDECLHPEDWGVRIIIGVVVAIVLGVILLVVGLVCCVAVAKNDKVAVDPEAGNAKGQTQ